MVIINNEGEEVIVRGILLSVIMDVLVKCLMQNFVQFNGFNGCFYCMQWGISVKISVKGYIYVYSFNRENFFKGYEIGRIYEIILKYAYDVYKLKLEGKYVFVFGVKGYLWFMFILGFDIIKGVVVDCMYCVLLGVIKMLMMLWFDKIYVSEDQSILKRVEEVDRCLFYINLFNCILRVLRSIEIDFVYWKVLEFCLFLFFYGIFFVFGIFYLMCIFSILCCLWK